MATQHFISCEIASETSFGSLDASTGIPSTGTLTYKSIEMIKDGLVYWGDPQMDMRENETRTNAYMPTPEPVTMRNCSTGAYQQHRTGEITIDFKLRTIGDGTEYVTADLIPWVMALNTAMAYSAPSAVAIDTVISGTNVNKFEPTLVGAYEIGKMIAVSIGNQLETAWVTDVGVDYVEVHPAFSRTLIAGDIVRFASVLYQDSQLTRGNSVAFRLQTTESRVYAFGCRANKIDFKVSQKQLTASITFKCAHIRDDRSGTPSPVAVDYADGTIPHLLGSYAIYSDIVDNSVIPATGSRNVMAIEPDTFNLSIENTMASTGYSGGLLESVDYEATDVKSSMEFVLGTPVAALDTMLWNREARGFFINFGPCGEGSGIGIAMFAGTAVADISKREFSDGIIKQKIMLRSGEYSQDNDSTDSANTPLRIGLVVL